MVKENPAPSMSQPIGLRGRRTATSVPIATVGSSALSRTSSAIE